MRHFFLLTRLNRPAKLSYGPQVSASKKLQHKINNAWNITNYYIDRLIVFTRLEFHKIAGTWALLLFITCTFYVSLSFSLPN